MTRMQNEPGGVEFDWRGPSPNRTQMTARPIDLIIIHDTEGGYEQSIQWLLNPASKVSANYVIRSSDGEISKMVAEHDIAWHAGNWEYNVRSIGIEHEGFAAAPGKWYTPQMLTASAKLVAERCRYWGIPIDRAHIIGHYEVPGQLPPAHTDPGPGWPWAAYMKLVETAYQAIVKEQVK
jgi:N-acetylmuramoyl-L-alanine amidase